MKLLSQQRKPCALPDKRLTLGELIARAYIVCGEKDAPHILYQAIEAQLVKYSRSQALRLPSNPRWLPLAYGEHPMALKPIPGEPTTSE